MFFFFLLSCSFFFNFIYLFLATKSVGAYTILLDNGPARKKDIARGLQEIGDIWGDPFEVSTLRREDFEAVQRSNTSFNVINAATNLGVRGHQSAAAFLMMYVP